MGREKNEQAQTIIDIQTSSESLSLATSGGNNDGVAREAWLEGLRNGPMHLLLHLPLYTFSCMNRHTHAHVTPHVFKTKTHNCWMLTEELWPLSLWIQWSLSHGPWSLLFPTPFSLPRCPRSASSIIPGPVEQEPNSTSLRISEPCWDVSSPPQLSLNITAALYTLQARRAPEVA